MRAAIASAAVAALAFAAASSGSVQFDRCSVGKLTFRVSTQTAPSRTVVTLSMIDGSADVCTVSGPVRFELLRSGKRFTAIKGNPATASLMEFQLLPGELDEVAHVWVSNWCKPRTGISMSVRYGGHTVESKLGITKLPVCGSAQRPTTIALPTGP